MYWAHLVLPLIFFQAPFITADGFDAAVCSRSDCQFHVLENWMDEIRDDVKLSELALPGTHDSASFTHYHPMVKTQELNFQDQLRYGIRVFDIRYRHIGNKFALHHGFVFLNIMFDEFLDIVDQFLLNHPRETVLFRLKKDYDDDVNNNRSDEDTLNEYLSQYSTYKRVTSNAQIGEVRGKFIILNNCQFDNVGIPYNSLMTQDDFFLESKFSLNSKWKKIRNHFEKAMDGDSSQFYMNYASGSGALSPLRVAIKTNNKAKDYIHEHLYSKRTAGIVMADYPGTALIKNVINSNNKLRI